VNIKIEGNLLMHLVFYDCPPLKNEHIAVAQVCLRCWSLHLDASGHSSVRAEAASQALWALESSAAEKRLLALRVASEPDMVTTIITVENLEDILCSVEHVIDDFGDTVPQYLEAVRSVFFAFLREPNQLIVKTFAAR
jgi:hypothetical protein